MLQLDVNHDGTMDTSWAGPDNTSSVQPFRFWVNNDCDYSSGSSDPGKKTLTDTNFRQDCNLANIPIRNRTLKIERGFGFAACLP